MSKPGAFGKCKDIEGFSNDGKIRCYSYGSGWLKNQSIFPEDQVESFELLKRELNKDLSIEDTYFVHRWMGKNCLRYCKGQNSPVCEARLNVLKTNWNVSLFVPFLNKAKPGDLIGTIFFTLDTEKPGHIDLVVDRVVDLLYVGAKGIEYKGETYTNILDVVRAIKSEGDETPLYTSSVYSRYK